MTNKLPVKSTVLIGEDERIKNDRRDRRVMTLKDLVAPQTVELFTISYELLTNGKRRS